MLVAKISFYFESAKKTGEKFREKFRFRNHHTAISFTQQVSRHDQGSIRHLSSWHIDPCRFPEVRGDMFAGQLILLPSLGVKQSVFIYVLYL